MIRSKRAPIQVILAALVAAAAGLAAQEPAAQFGDTVDVRVVNVEVVVTDRDGNPVAGLGRDDFRLAVDGRPVAISNFYAGERRAQRPEAAQPPRAETKTAATGETAAEATLDARPPRLVVWIDDLTLVPGQRNRVLKQLGEFLAEQERRGTEILIARFDRSVEVIRPFGERRRPVAADLDALQRRTAGGVFVEVGRREAIREIRELYTDSGCGRVDDMARIAERYAEPLRGEVLAGVQGLTNWVRALAGLEGRKAMLYVSGGVPIVPGQEMELLIDQLCQRSTSLGKTETLVNDLRRVTVAANAAGVSFYTFAAQGLSLDVSAADVAPGLGDGNNFLARANQKDALANFASETGGRSLLDANRIDTLTRALADDLESYYSLGFSPIGEPDGGEHRIEVEVAREGLRVRHRSGFVDRPAAERASDRLQASLRFGGESDPLGVEIETGEVKRIDGKTATVAVRIVVPAARLVFLPGEKGETARLEISLVAADSEGRLSPEQRRTLSVPRSQLAGDLDSAFLRFPLDLTLRQGPAVLAVAVRDLHGASEAIVRRELLVR